MSYRHPQKEIASFLGGNNIVLGGNSIILGGNSIILGGNSIVLGGNGIVLVEIASFLVVTASFLVEIASFLGILGARQFFGLCWKSFAAARGAAGTCRAAASVVLLGVFEELQLRAACVCGRCGSCLETLSSLDRKISSFET